jgi:hypothetical protein
MIGVSLRGVKEWKPQLLPKTLANKQLKVGPKIPTAGHRNLVTRPEDCVMFTASDEFVRRVTLAPNGLPSGFGGEKRKSFRLY